MILPFGLLLGLIALSPLFFPGWWAKHYPKVAFGLGAVTLSYYLFSAQPGTTHSSAHSRALRQFHCAHWIAVRGLGGIHVNVKGGNPARECPLPADRRGHRQCAGHDRRVHVDDPSLDSDEPVSHHGFSRRVLHLHCLQRGWLPDARGRPAAVSRLLLGVPFWWVVEHCWAIWLTGIGILLAMFYACDRVNYQRAPKQVRAALAEPEDQWRFDGLANLFFLAVILGAVFIDKPLFVREALMLAASVGSYFTTKKQIHRANHFNFHPIQEVAILFVGIFATMMPALDWLQSNAGAFGQPTPTLYYWSTGALSSLLDNAPTYLSFLTAIFGSIDPEIITQVQHLVQTGGSDRGHHRSARAGDCQHFRGSSKTSWYGRRLGPRVQGGDRDCLPHRECGSERSSGCGQCGSGFLWGDDVHWQRAEFHGQSHCGASEGAHAGVLGVYLQIHRAGDAPDAFARLVAVSAVTVKPPVKGGSRKPLPQRPVFERYIAFRIRECARFTTICSSSAFA
jgi:hypothetical protein